MENVPVMRARLAGIAAAMVFALLAVAFSPPDAAAQAPPGKEHKGISLLTLPPNPAITYDVDLVDPLPALDSLAAALDIIFKESPFSAGKIEALKKDGKVVIIYDPNHPDPKTSMASIKVAEFRPHYRDIGGKGSKNYIAVVGRHGIKWPVREMAAILVHELVGHGTQHLYDRLKTTRNVDLECEAWLYEELAYQDFRFDKFSRQMIEFRQQLEGVGFINGYCTDFKRHMQKNDPDRVTLWESLNPDVPKLLAAFEDYLGDLRETGVTGAALAAVKKLGESEKEKKFNDSSPEEQFQVALTQLSGIGKQPDWTTAAKWFRKSADQGFDLAQANLAGMYRRGQGVPKDYAKAAEWYRKAAVQGHAEAQYALGSMYAKGQGVKKDPDEAARWMRLVADKGFDRAQYVLANMYARGQGVKKDPGEAARLMRLAADKGYDRAQYALGSMYAKGKGVKKDPGEAAKWVRLAADQGHAGAQYVLANLYSAGKGVAKSREQAYFWLTLSAGRAKEKLKKKVTDKRNQLAKSLEPALISEIEDRASKWLPNTKER